MYLGNLASTPEKTICFKPSSGSASILINPGDPLRACFGVPSGWPLALRFWPRPGGLGLACEETSYFSSCLMLAWLLDILFLPWPLVARGVPLACEARVVSGSFFSAAGLAFVVVLVDGLALVLFSARDGVVFVVVPEDLLVFVFCVVVLVTRTFFSGPLSFFSALGRFSVYVVATVSPNCFNLRCLPDLRGRPVGSANHIS